MLCILCTYIYKIHFYIYLYIKKTKCAVRCVYDRRCEMLNVVVFVDIIRSCFQSFYVSSTTSSCDSNFRGLYHPSFIISSLSSLYVVVVVVIVIISDLVLFFVFVCSSLASLDVVSSPPSTVGSLSLQAKNYLLSFSFSYFGFT